ncbi:hypothetical protein Tco_0664004 [Tanacetum coccineum]
MVESYNTDKDIITSYGDVVTLKRGRYDQDKDENPFAGSNRGSKIRKFGKDAESSKDSRSKEKNSLSTSKDAFQSQHKSSGKPAHAEEPSDIVEDTGMQRDQDFVTGDNDEQPANKETWISQVTRTVEPPTSFDEFNDTSFDFSAFVLNRIKIPNLIQEILVGSAFNLLKGTCKSITKLEYHLEEYHQGRQIIPHDYFLNNDLEYLKGGELSRRYSTSVTKTKAATYDLKWIEDLVRNLSNIRNRTAYTSYSDPHGMIYVDQFKRKRLMRADELYKFSDGTLNDVRTTLHDIAAGIRMEYLLMRKLSNLDKKRARVMVQDIDKQLYQGRLMRNLEKFVGGRIYERDLRLLERTI